MCWFQLRIRKLCKSGILLYYSSTECYRCKVFRAMNICSHSWFFSRLELDHDLESFRDTLCFVILYPMYHYTRLCMIGMYFVFLNELDYYRTNFSYRKQMYFVQNNTWMNNSNEQSQYATLTNDNFNWNS